MPKRKRLIAVFCAIIFALFFLIGFLRKNYIAPIIMYHSINPQPNPAIKRLIVSPRTFERQARFLKEHKYNILPLEYLAGLIKDKKKIPSRALAITFDDGYRDNYTYAFPVLKKYNLPATIFIIVDEIGRPQGDRLSWAEIKEMQNSGLITFGSHCLGPEPLVNIKSEEELRKQIFGSKRILDEELGQPVTIFSYPGGMFNARIKKLVKEAGYKFAVATLPGKKFASDDVFLLKRLRISERDSNLLIFRFKTSGFYTSLKESRRKNLR